MLPTPAQLRWWSSRSTLKHPAPFNSNCSQHCSVSTPDIIWGKKGQSLNSWVLFFCSTKDTRAWFLIGTEFSQVVHRAVLRLTPSQAEEQQHREGGCLMSWVPATHLQGLRTLLARSGGRGASFLIINTLVSSQFSSR